MEISRDIMSQTPANISNTNLMDDLHMDSNFVWLLCSLIFAISWVMYITYYNSRLTGYIITKIVNRLFVGDGYMKIGSLTLNALSGKIMFRDFVYITHDYTVRVQDGYLIFRWWRSYVPKDVSEDLSHSDTRLSVVLNGFELHVYNRGALYAHLEKTFGLEPSLFPPNTDTEATSTEQHLNEENNTLNEDQTMERSRSRHRPEAAMARTWRDLIPVIKCDISSGRVVFGNRLVPTSLSITVEESHWVYSTKPAASTLDKLMHFVKCWAENARVMLVPSLKYTGMLDEPPRYMGEGFVLMATNYLELYGYMDEPGLVPEQPVLVCLANGDVVESSPPMWGVDIKCGKGTDFSYGPWADRQREHLFKFFYPNDYQPMKVTKTPKPGDKREMHTFDIRLSMLNEATIDVLFSKNKETNAVHINVGPGSYLEITLPWIVLQDGCTTKITGQLLHLEATTSLQYRDLVSSETLEFSINCHYPLMWNAHQDWHLSMTGCKATVNLVYAHKHFFSDLVNDWSSKSRPDLLHFVPYTWRFGLTLKHSELLTCSNMYNWVDCSSIGQKQRLENSRLALCAHLFHLSFDLPFDHFLPDTVPLTFTIQGESIDLSLFVPEVCTSRDIILALEKYAKVLSKEGSLRQQKENIPKWRNVCQKSAGWIDFWWVPIGAISIQWVYHPAPPLGPQPQADISTPVKEELLLSPMRFPHCKKRTHRSPDGTKKFDPTSLSPDKVTVELEIGPSVLLLYGIALRNFVHLKENIFGDDQQFTDMYETSSGQAHPHPSEYENGDDLSSLPLELQEDFDERYYRPLEVDVNIIIHDIQAHLLKFCSEADPPCPIILIERFGFEMKKRYDQTEMQLLLSPSVLLVSDMVSRAPGDASLNNGRLALSSLQLRGHAMFSDVERTLDQDTIEYAWLLELQLGKLSGKITLPQMHQLVSSLELMVMLMSDSENELMSPHIAPSQPPATPGTVPQQSSINSNINTAAQSLAASVSAVRQSLSNSTQQSSTLQAILQNRPSTKTPSQPPQKPPKPQTTVTNKGINMPSAQEMNTDSHKLKYKFCRVSCDALDIWLVESGAALQLWISPIRVANCNLHGKQVGSGLSCVIYNTMLRQLVANTQPLPVDKLETAWCEVGSVQLGNLVIEAIMSLSGPENQVPLLQNKFLKMHDDRTKRLWFLWPDITKGVGRCGCVGGCMFFGSNKNGAKFFKPSQTDLNDGINIAAFRINETGRDLGYGQSLLHDGQLLFRTPPYTAKEVVLQELGRRPSMVQVKKQPETTATVSDFIYQNRQYDNTAFEAPNSASPATSSTALDKKINRRFSYTLTRNNGKDVPYSRLVDPPLLPAKLDSDSKLHTTEKTKTILHVPETSDGPKNSISDSKLAVDYFQTQVDSRNHAPSYTSSSKSDTCSPQLPTKISSESHHSLSTRLGSEEKLRQEVQRTISMSSENQSEAFFSADEELNPSRTSSLRHSIIGSGTVLNSPDMGSGGRRFASDLSIVTDRSGVREAVEQKTGGSGPTSLTETIKTKLSSHRSDHQIHTPEHRTITGNLFDQSLLARSPRLPEIVDGCHDLTETQSVSSDRSGSLSSNSYASAVCSQDDMTLVDLHMQLNKNIVDSPMLMSSYVGHLSQIKCTNWNTNSPLRTHDLTPLFSQEEGGERLVYIGGKFVPQMDTITEGFTLLKMVPRPEYFPSGGVSPTATTSGYTSVWDSQTNQNIASNNLEDECNLLNEDELLTLKGEVASGSRTAVIIRLQGELDLTATPLLLECLQRYIDALTPTLATLHPLTVVTNLHGSCLSNVEAANMLKRNGDVAARIRGDTMGDNMGDKLINSAPNVLKKVTPGSGIYEEYVRTQLQVAVFLPKVNITLLQASIVEEIISFSALDNIRDLTCVSLFTLCFDNTVARLHLGRQARELVQIFHRPAVMQPHNKKDTKMKSFIMSHLGGATNTDIIHGEPVYIETSERQQEELVVQLTVGKVHGQLRRLRNDSSIINDAVITAIPLQHSKVLFSCAKINQPLREVEYYLMPKQETGTQQEEFNSEDKLGFIMFETGLEGIAIKIVKKSQFEKLDEPEKDEEVPKPADVEIINERVKDDESLDKQSEASTQTDNYKPEKTDKPDKQEKQDKLERAGATKENTSSCVIELKTVWFNFAAPPRAPITRKLDYTRLDWNLLSTASPAINAWLNPSNRFAIRVVHMVRTMYRRSTGVIACLMAEALDVQTIHVPPKSKYGKLTPLAKTLQEDPSCQLCAVLEKYIVDITDIQSIELSLRDSELPQLSTLRQGIIVLSRQWKNVLYTPLLLDHNYKTKFIRPLNVTFAVSEMDEEICLTDGEASANDEPDVTDECAMLLRNNEMLKQNKATCVESVGVGVPAQVAVISEGIESVLTSPSPPVIPHRRHKRQLQPTQVPASSRASVVFPILGFNGRRLPDEGVDDGRIPAGSDPSVCSQSSPDLPNSPPYHQPITTATTSGTIGRSAGTPAAAGNAAGNSASCEDLYSWMAKQQEYVRSNGNQHVRQNVDILHKDVYIGQESKVNTLATDSSGEGVPEHPNTAMAGVSLYPMQDSLRLLDAHLIFQPLLSSMGVMPQQMVGAAAQPLPPGHANGAGATVTPNTSSLDSLGSNLSLVGSMEQMRIDIVVSEHGRKTNKSKSANQNLHIDVTDETPAFVCERVSLEVEVDKMADMTVDDMIRTRNVLYISRGQLKKHTSTALNFSIGVRHISQQVNMPLLRLLHQITNMYQNVKDTQMELKEQKPELRQHTLATSIIGTPLLRRNIESNDQIHHHHDGPDYNDIVVTIAKNPSSSTSDLQDITLVENKPLSLKISDPSSILSQATKPVISPSASVRSRPQSFAQKLRSTGKSVRGYMNLSEGVGTPLFTGSPSVSGGLTVGSDKSNGIPGSCWKTVYHLLDLYATMPETKTITHRFSMAPDISEHYKGTRKYDVLTEAKSIEDVENGGNTTSTPIPTRNDPLSFTSGERTRLVVFGVARIHRTRLLATLSGLKLEAEITSLHSSLTWRKKSKPASLEFSLTGQIGRTMIVLLEGVAPNQQTVVKVTVGKSQALYSSVSKRTKDKNSGLLTVGAVNIDIPQHPVALHGMVTRGSKQLSSTLQELRVTRTASRMSRSAQPDHPLPEDYFPFYASQSSQSKENQSSPNHQFSAQAAREPHSSQTAQTAHHADKEAASTSLLQPLVMQFSVILQSLSITAALLPSLQAQYKMDQVNSTGVTGSRAKFTIDLPHHSLSFTTKLVAVEANLPSEASIALPAVHVAAEYVPEGCRDPATSATNAEGLVLKKGGYLSAFAEIGVFEHSLTTDLLNHLVFVQKVFMREVNEVVQKVYGGERPVRLWIDDEEPAAPASTNTSATSSALSRILFSLVIRIQRIQLTATTAGSSAVRLETGAVALEISNRVQNVSGASSKEAVRLFGKAQVDINLCLGQLTRNPMFEEAEPDFQQFAFFNTRIGLRNAFQDEMVDGENKEVVLITLKRPLIYVQPLAVDKAIIVWLNYKNAYEYWNEKRANLNKEVLTATQQVLEKVPFGQITSQLAAAAAGPSLGTLFLQLTVDDMGICLPLNPLPLASWNVGGGNSTRGLYDEARGAVVVTLESTSIAACSSGSLVSKGRFANLCLRFAEDFDPSLDDWKPDMNDANIMNLCVVSEGTYEVCSRTIAAKQEENAKWFLNVQWQMEGVDINLDVNVGKQLSALGHTLTMLTGAEDGPAHSIDGDSEDQDRIDEGSRASQDSLVNRNSNLPFDFTQTGPSSGNLASIPSIGTSSNSIRRLAETLPAFVLDPNLDAKKRSKLIERELNEQAKIINDLRSLGASHGTIEQEMRRLHELEALVFKDFRRDMIQKLRRQSVKASSIKGKLGLGSRASAYRSKSFIIPSPTPERHIEIESPEDLPASYESSPRSGPSRTASLRVRSGTVGASGPRVTFSDSHRQCSLPSADSEISLSQWSSPGQGDHMDIDGEKVELRRKAPPTSYESVDQPLIDPIDTQNRVTSSNTSTYIPQKPQEPNIDFELDVKVLINSGKCVLHTKDPIREEDLKVNRMRKDRSCSAGLLEFPLTQTGSPDPTRRNKEGKGGKEPPNANTSGGGRYRPSAGVQAPHPNQLIDLTIFHIPGMDIKLHYESKIIQDESDVKPSPKPQSVFEKSDVSETESDVPDPLTSSPGSSSSKSSHLGISNPNYNPGSTSSDLDLSHLEEKRDDFKPLGWQANKEGRESRKAGIKKASLFAWMTLQSIPEETIISPHILEFLEQTLEPIPSKTNYNNTSTFSQGVDPAADLSSSGTGGLPTTSGYGTYVYTSFPVDVIVYFHMAPSTFRFSCLPVSRVECMLQLPSLDIVFSSKRAEEETFGEFNSADKGPTTSASFTPATAVGGLSVTGCLADFSVYIFHPYGGGKKSGLKEAQWSPLADSERKDSLSINVEFVKFHLSRSRKLNFQQESDITGKLSDQSRAVIRFSTIIDIGSASFKYDMRRLTEILAFPKAWYRRSIVRRLFLGDLSGIGAMYSDEGDDTIPEEDVTTSTPPQSARKFERQDSHTPGLSKSAPAAERSPMLSAREKLRLSLEHDKRTPRLRDINKSVFSSSESALSGSRMLIIDADDLENTPSPSEAKAGAAWETLVLFAVNFTKLNVHMNMGNVMGNVTWQTKDFRSEGRLSIGSTGHKNMYIALGLAGSTLDAKGGIVGGTIEIANIDTYIHIREEPNLEPDHTIGLKLFALELRLDYMGTSVLMSRVSALDVTLRDEWRLNRDQGHNERESGGFMPPTRRPATIFVHGVLGWDQLQLMISKSSTADLTKMYHKLEEFFSQQFNSSKRVFSRLGPSRPHQSQPGHLRNYHHGAARITPSTSATASLAMDDARHHRHWQKALRHVAGLQLSTVHWPLPATGTVLGGTVELRGQNISLACFHGINFKSKSWALFSLKEPCISFNTEAQEIPSMTSDKLHDVHIVQTLTCSLGLSTYKTAHSMATVCKISRNVLFPPQFKTLQEWFQYAFASSIIDEVDRFPSLERERPETATNSIERARNTQNKLQDPNHTREIIFALPSLQLHLKTEHLQTAGTPGPNSEKPIVDCSFITEFEDHIFVTVDAEAFFFLHDLITSYLKEKEKFVSSATGIRAGSPDPEKLRNSSTSSSLSNEKKSQSSAASSTPSGPSSANLSPEDFFTKDWRSYQCKTWVMEPTVRLLSWAGKSIEPYGIDYILQKLGFNHARTTIPKWTQRGCMDPLDKILAVLTLKMVAIIKDERNSNRSIEGHKKSY